MTESDIEKQRRLQKLADAGIPREVLGGSTPATVVNLDEHRKPDVWSCDCGCVVFYYQHDHNLVCIDCATVQHGWKPEDRE